MNTHMKLGKIYDHVIKQKIFLLFLEKTTIYVYDLNENRSYAHTAYLVDYGIIFEKF